MFDTPDLGPLCIAPWIGLWAGIVVYLLAVFFTRRLPKFGWIAPLPISLIICLVVTYASISLRIGEHDTTPWVMPSSKDVVGTWHLEPHFVDHLREFQGYVVPPHSIEFREDGTFEMRNVPNLWITLSDEGSDDQTEFDAEGTWTIADQDSIYYSKPIYVVFLRYEYLNLDNVDLAETPVYVDGKIPIFFRGHIPPYSLDAIGYDTYNPFMRFVRE